MLRFFSVFFYIIFLLLQIAKGYITVQVLRDILHELDDKIPPGDLDLMIDEIDADGSGTVDFEGDASFYHSIEMIYQFSYMYTIHSIFFDFSLNSF